MYELNRIKQAVVHAINIGLAVNAGHGLHYHNVKQIAAIPGIEELNIGHAIVAHALFVGWDNAVREMKALMIEVPAGVNAMIYGIGTDIVEVSRIEHSLQHYGLAFAQRILNEREWLSFTQSKTQARFLAKRFAAKEAFAKALGTGLRTPATFQNIGVAHDDLGQPGA